MKTLIASGLLILASLTAQASEVKSMEDLPKSWSGSAGDLFNLTSASLEISSLTQTAKKQTGPYVQISYHSAATLKVGTRSFSVVTIDFSYMTDMKDHFEVLFTTTDEHIPFVSGGISVDGKTGSVTFKEMAREGSAARFILSGK